MRVGVCVEAETGIDRFSAARWSANVRHQNDAFTQPALLDQAMSFGCTLERQAPRAAGSEHAVAQVTSEPTQHWRLALGLEHAHRARLQAWIAYRVRLAE